MKSVHETCCKVAKDDDFNISWSPCQYNIMQHHSCMQSVGPLNFSVLFQNGSDRSWSFSIAKSTTLTFWHFCAVLYICAGASEWLATSFLDAQDLVSSHVCRVFQDIVHGGSQLWTRLPSPDGSAGLRPWNSTFDLGGSPSQGQKVAGPGDRAIRRGFGGHSGWWWVSARRDDEDQWDSRLGRKVDGWLVRVRVARQQVRRQTYCNTGEERQSRDAPTSPNAGPWQWQPKGARIRGHNNLPTRH